MVADKWQKDYQTIFNKHAFSLFREHKGDGLLYESFIADKHNKIILVIKIRFPVGRYSRQKQVFLPPTGTEYTLDCSLRMTFDPLPPTTLSQQEPKSHNPLHIRREPVARLSI